MVYPNFIQKGHIIGVTACSAGKDNALDAVRLDQAAAHFQRAGYEVLETSSCRKCEKGRSADAETRVKELEELLYHEKVDCIIQAAGGSYLLEILDKLNFDLILEKKKWIQGYSDPTGLLYTITVNTGLATIYGSNYGDFGMEEWHPSLQDNLTFLEGGWNFAKGFQQKSYIKYQLEHLERITGVEGYEAKEEVKWKNTAGAKTIQAEGRMLGGCLDVLMHLAGTKFDQTKAFIHGCREDGIIWYLESFDLNSERLLLGLWNLKHAGWFDTAKAFLFGRPLFYDSEHGISYEETVWEALKDLGVPIILDACFGHMPPRMLIINAAMGRVHSGGGKGSLTQWLQ